MAKRERILLVSSIILSLAIAIIFRKEKVTHLQLYVEDVLTGPTPTSVQVAMASTSLSSPTLFGLVFVLNDPVRLSPNTSSEIVARLQGYYSFVSLDVNDKAIHVSLDVVFKTGEYSGSSFTVVGNNRFERPHRELTIVGGTGVFRSARGWINQTTIYARNDSALFHYDVTLLH